MVGEKLDDVIALINAWQEAQFNKCINKPVYQCSKGIVISAEGAVVFGKTNGEFNYYSLKRTNFGQNRNASGVVTSGSSPTGDLGAEVRWSCPETHSRKAVSLAPKEVKLTCVLSVLDPLKNAGPAGDTCPSPNKGNPINISIGNKYQEEFDFQSSGPAGLNFSRAYNSLHGYWRHNYSTLLEVDEVLKRMYLTKDGGVLSIFYLNNGVATSEGLDSGKLSKISGNWVYTSEENEQSIFNSSGRLLQQKYTSGLERNFVYDGNKVIVTDNFGNTLEFTEGPYNQPLSFKSGLVQGAYSYNPNNKLAKVETTIGEEVKTRLYHYEDSRNVNLLTGITDERGIRYATWAYDDKGRAISSEHANGIEKILISYNADGSSTVTNELGKKTHYNFQTFKGLKRIIAISGEPSANCPNSNSKFTYNSNAQLTSKTNNKGNRTTYIYNSRSLETSRTEAAGTPQARTITTEWHPTLFVRTKVTEPTRITTYTYDAQGRQLSQSVTQR